MSLRKNKEGVKLEQNKYCEKNIYDFFFLM